MQKNSEFVADKLEAAADALMAIAVLMRLEKVLPSYHSHTVGILAMELTDLCERMAENDSS